MGHCITALIGSRDALASLIGRFDPPDPIDLAFGLVLVPLNEQRMDAIAMSVEPPLEGFTYLTPAMARAIGDAVGGGRALYIETEYFGGSGGQGAALFEAGGLSWQDAESTFESAASKSSITRFFSPSARSAQSPISAGLARLGVVPESGQDEFDRIGLGRFRSLDELGFDQDE